MSFVCPGMRFKFGGRWLSALLSKCERAPESVYKANSALPHGPIAKESSKPKSEYEPFHMSGMPKTKPSCAVSFNDDVLLLSESLQSSSKVS